MAAAPHRNDPVTLETVAGGHGAKRTAYVRCQAVDLEDEERIAISAGVARQGTPETCGATAGRYSSSSSDWSWVGPESLPLASGSRSTSSMIAMGAESP
jgi:hypothetical protein